MLAETPVDALSNSQTKSKTLLPHMNDAPEGLKMILSESDEIIQKRLEGLTWDPETGTNITYTSLNLTNIPVFLSFINVHTGV